MEGLSKKELKVISFLEFHEMFFFIRSDIKQFFRNVNEMNVYLHRLRKKGRIIKLNKTKYYLIPIKAFKGHWSEHPFIIIDEIFNGKDYFIGGMAAANYYRLIEQIPTKIEVYSSKKQGNKKFFNFTILFRRIRSLNPRDYVKKELKKHTFIIASNKKIEKWLKSR